MDRIIGQVEDEEEDDVKAEKQSDTRQEERGKYWRSYQLIVDIEWVLYTKGRVYTRPEQFGHTNECKELSGPL